MKTTATRIALSLEALPWTQNANGVGRHIKIDLENPDPIMMPIFSVFPDLQNGNTAMVEGHQIRLFRQQGAQSRYCTFYDNGIPKQIPAATNSSTTSTPPPTGTTKPAWQKSAEEKPFYVPDKPKAYHFAESFEEFNDLMELNNESWKEGKRIRPLFEHTILIKKNKADPDTAVVQGMILVREKDLHFKKKTP